jgi:hypothetical protein
MFVRVIFLLKVLFSLRSDQVHTQDVGFWYKLNSASQI